MSLARNIYLIDDDNTITFITEKIIMLSGINANITTFNDGQEALDFLKENANNTEILPDVIFLDINMPVMDGWGFLDEYVPFKNQLKRDATLYMVSSSISPHDMERAKNYSIVKEFIIKPLGKEKIISINESLPI